MAGGPETPCTSGVALGAETRYSQLEFMALLFACKRFHGFIIEQKFIIESDNMPILSFFRKIIDSLPWRIQGWMLAIQPYDFSGRHIAGKLNVIADGLSRNPNTMCDATHEISDNSIVCFIMESIPITRDS